MDIGDVLHTWHSPTSTLLHQLLYVAVFLQSGLLVHGSESFVMCIMSVRCNKG